MLAVHPPPHQMRHTRHPQLQDLNRGRSRDISPVAIARRASEERRLAQRRAAANALRVADASSMKQVNNAVQDTRPPISHNLPPQPVASTSTLPAPPAMTGTKPKRLSNLSLTVAAAAQVPVLPRLTSSASSGSTVTITQRNYLVRSPSPEDERERSPDPPRSLQDQMQEAYAADDMYTARVLYLKIQGIDICSPDDPRIAAVRDEDFEFVPGGQLVLDDEALAALRDAQAQQERRATVHVQTSTRQESGKGKGVDKRWQEREQTWEREAERVRAAKALARRMRGENVTKQPQVQRLEIKASGHTLRRGRPHHANPFGRTSSYIDSSSTSFSLSVSPSTSSTRNTAGLSSSLPTNPRLARTPPACVSFKEVVRCLQGPLFPRTDEEERCRGPRTKAQEQLLDVLLQVPDVRGKGRRAEAYLAVMPMTGPGVRSGWRQSTHSDLARLACSAETTGTGSSISRTNSWASSTSDASLSTLVTSAPNSPNLDKAPLPPLLDDDAFRRMALQVSASRSHVYQRRALQSRSKLVAVPLTKTPLLTRVDDDELAQDLQEGRRTLRERKHSEGKNALLSRVRASVSSLLDIANKMQLTYIRTVQFSVPSAAFAEPEPSVSSQLAALTARLAAARSPLKPMGYRVNILDVNKFTPRPASPPVRDLNLPSDFNIPLADALPAISITTTSPSSVSTIFEHPSAGRGKSAFAPIGFVPPSAHRMAYCTPLTPDWRLRYVANPVTLRLKALSNMLGAHGIPWEGRAHSGSLGYGRDRVMGVAFEGLGGSRLAFEARD